MSVSHVGVHARGCDFDLAVSLVSVDDLGEADGVGVAVHIVGVDGAGQGFPIGQAYLELDIVAGDVSRPIRIHPTYPHNVPSLLQLLAPDFLLLPRHVLLGPHFIVNGHSIFLEVVQSSFHFLYFNLEIADFQGFDAFLPVDVLQPDFFLELGQIIKIDNEAGN